MNRRSPLQRLARLSPPARRFAALAWLGAPAVELSLATLGLKRTLAWIEAVPSRAGSGERVAPSEGARLVGGAYSAHALRGECLPRSLLQYLLHRREGTPVRFVVGVRRETAERRDVYQGRSPFGRDVAAHAWVEGLDPAAPTRAPATFPGFESILVSEFGGARA